MTNPATHAPAPEPASDSPTESGPSSPPPAASGAVWRRRFAWAWPMAILVAVLVIYLPALGAALSFIDDPEIVHSDRLTSVTLENWLAIFTTPHFVDYRPIGESSLLFEAALFPTTGDAAHAIGHDLSIERRLAATRVGNLLLHALNAVLVWLVLGRLMPHRSPLLSGVPAVLLAVHPLAVESVVWLTGRYNLLALTFTLGSVWAYLRWRLGPASDPPTASRGHWAWLLVSTGLLALGLLTKAWAVTGTGLIVLLEWTVLRGGIWRGLLRALPAIAVTLAFAILSAAIVFQSQEAVGWRENLTTHMPLLPRYLSHFIAPLNLSFYYTVPAQSMAQFVLAGAVAVAILGGWWWLAGHDRMATLALGWMLGPLLLVLGFLPVQWGHFHDRYFYFSLPGAALLLGLSIERLAMFARAKKSVAGAETESIAGGAAASPGVSRVGLVALLVTALVLTGLSRRQADTWESAETLLAHGNTVSPDSALLAYTMGNLYERMAKTTPQSADEFRHRAAMWYGRALVESADFDVVLPPMRQLVVIREVVRTAVANGEAESAASLLPIAELIAQRETVFFGVLAQIHHLLGDADRAASIYRELFSRMTVTRELVGELARETHGRTWLADGPAWYVARGDAVIRANELTLYRPLFAEFPALAAHRQWPEAREAAHAALAIYSNDREVVAAARDVLVSLDEPADVIADLARYIDQLPTAEKAAHQ